MGCVALGCGWVGVWRVGGFGVCVGLEQKPFSPGFHLFTLDPHGGFGLGWRVSGFGLRCVGVWVGGCVEGWGFRCERERESVGLEQKLVSPWTHMGGLGWVALGGLGWNRNSPWSHPAACSMQPVEPQSHWGLSCYTGNSSCSNGASFRLARACAPASPILL